MRDLNSRFDFKNRPVRSWEVYELSKTPCGLCRRDELRIFWGASRHPVLLAQCILLELFYNAVSVSYLKYNNDYSDVPFTLNELAHFPCYEVE
jgi:hypothetical protein